MTEQQVRDYNARMFGVVKEKRTPTVDDEATLHDQILNECRRRGWIALHGSMAHRTFRTEGEWDFTIVADAGRVFFVEGKTATGKLSTEQHGMIAWASKLGHQVHVVRSFEAFIEIIRPLKACPHCGLTQPVDHLKCDDCAADFPTGATCG